MHNVIISSFFCAGGKMLYSGVRCFLKSKAHVFSRVICYTILRTHILGGILMRVEIKVETDCRDPYAVLHIARLTPPCRPL